MKTKFILVVLLISSFFTSCKNENTDLEKDNVTVTIETVFGKNDYLKISYLKNGTWSDDNTLSKPIYASNQMQKIEFDLPKGIKPENIRFNVGYNPTQNYVTIKNITIKYKSQIIDGDMGKYSKYFSTNGFIFWDSDYVGYKLAKINNQYDPTLTGNDLLIGKLKKLEY